MMTFCKAEIILVAVWKHYKLCAVGPFLLT
jgi:hypothetical protein